MSSVCISDEQWSKLYNFLRHHQRIYVVREQELKQFIEGVFWINRTGAQWRELPACYGHWNTVYSRFNEWSRKGIWQAMLSHMSHNADEQQWLLDSTVVRAHACAAGYPASDADQQGLGRSRGGLSSKVHLATDALGLPVRINVTGGHVHDMKQASTLIDGVHDTQVIADKGYDSDELVRQLQDQSCEVVIPPKQHRKHQRGYDQHAYKERHLIECLIGKLKQFRRIFARFDKKLRNYMAFWCLGGALLWAK